MNTAETVTRTVKVRKPVRVVRAAPARAGQNSSGHKPSVADAAAMLDEANATVRRILALMDREDELLGSSLRGLVETRRTLEWSNRYAHERGQSEPEAAVPASAGSDGA